MPTAEPCLILDWDSQHFGFRVARVEEGRLTPERAAQVLAWCQDRAVTCAYLLADVADRTTIRLAQQHGFDLVDVRVTLAAALGPSTPRPAAGSADSIRASRPEDVELLCAIARQSFQHSRFYADGRFPRDRCDALYAQWVENCCRAAPDAVLVAERAGQVAGFITCDTPRAGAGRIGLLAVAAAAQGQGLGRHLVEAAFGWFAQRELRTVSVGTQARNLLAQRLYQRCGFVTHALQLCYHRWFLPPTPIK